MYIRHWLLFKKLGLQVFLPSSQSMILQSTLQPRAKNKLDAQWISLSLKSTSTLPFQVLPGCNYVSPFGKLRLRKYSSWSRLIVLIICDPIQVLAKIAVLFLEILNQISFRLCLDLFLEEQSVVRIPSSLRCNISLSFCSFSFSVFAILWRHGCSKKFHMRTVLSYRG